MSIPNHLRYTKEHEWILVEGDHATIGVTAYAIDQLGDVVHLELPKVGSLFKKGDTFGTIESTKTVSDLYMPAAGEVAEINTHILNSPEDLAQDPYQKGWLLKIKVSNFEKQETLSSDDYEKYIAS